jgi:hypothetical protein
MTQASKLGILYDDNSTTYERLLESKTPEITTLVHFSAASEAVPLRVRGVGLRPLRELALRLNPEVPQWLKPP